MIICARSVYSHCDQKTDGREGPGLKEGLNNFLFYEKGAQEMHVPTSHFYCSLPFRQAVACASPKVILTRPQKFLDEQN